MLRTPNPKIPSFVRALEGYNQIMSRPAGRSFFRKILRFFKWVFCSFLGFIVLAGVGGFILYLQISKDLPQLDKIEDYQPPVMAEVFDEEGKKIGEFWTEARILTPIDQVPKKMIEAFVASDDDRFFEHSGVDPYGIVRAFWTNLQAGHVVQGASTITQQVTKALLLSPERTYDRKIKEAILATRIEKNLSKDQILYIYLNQIFFGNRAYGIGAAARNYFHKSLDQLNVAEMAMIVGLAKAPSTFNPLVNPERARQRMFYVIDRMQEEGYLTAQQAEEAKKTPLQIYKAGTDKDFNKKFAPYFVEHVRRALQKKYGDKLYTGGWKIFTTANLQMNQEAQQAVRDGVKRFAKMFGYRGPLQRLQTEPGIEAFSRAYHQTLLDEQDLVNYFGDEEMKKSLAQPTPLFPDRIYLGIITGVDAQGLEVKVGHAEGNISREGIGWSKTPARRTEAWTPAVGDVIEVQLKVADPKKAKEGAAVTTLRQFSLEQTPAVQAALFSFEPFSGAIKSIIGGQDYEKSEFNRATQALRQPGSSIKPLIYAAALDKGYTPGTVVMDSPIVYEESAGKFWNPKNYGGKYYGPTAFRHALVNSRNVVTVRILMDIGTHYAAGFMRKLGISTPIFKYYSMALGANEVFLEELSTAYGTFVTGGIKPESYFVQKIVDPRGNLIEEHQDPKHPYLISYKNVEEPAKKGEKGAEGRPPAPPASPKPTPVAQVESRPSAETQPSGKKSKNWDEMGYNGRLLEMGVKATSGDELVLTEYEKKVLYGDYLPEGYTLTPKTAMTMVSILHDVVRAGTGTRALALKKPAAGKTGTTNGETDAWFVGFTPTLLTGVWVGFDDKIHSLPRGSTGGNTAAPIWLAFMEKATQRYPTQNFTIPAFIDLSIYEAPIQVAASGGDAELGEAGVGTGVQTAGAGTAGGGGGAEFFTKDLE